MRIVILAAGVGSRLGNPFPKSLTELSDGRTILGRQLDGLATAFDPTDVMIVVGFKKDMVMEAFPNVLFAYNQDFGETNTSKSLLSALRLSSADEGVLWLNGDVVFETELVERLAELIAENRSFVCVNTASVGDEEVKYRADDVGHILELSKQVVGAHGEAVGVNYVAPHHKATLIERLHECDDHDYFERGMELAIELDGVEFFAADVGSGLCIEVDFPEDLRRANEAIESSR